MSIVPVKIADIIELLEDCYFEDNPEYCPKAERSTT